MLQVLGSVHETWLGSNKHALEYAALGRNPSVTTGISARQKPIHNAQSTIHIGTGHRSLTTHSLYFSYFSVRSFLNPLLSHSASF